MLEAIRELYRHNLAVREKLFAALRELSDEEYRRDLKTGVGRICYTLWHMAESEDYWFGRVLVGDGPRLPEVKRERLPPPAELPAVWQPVVDRTTAYLAGLADADLEREVAWRWSSGEAVRFTVGKALLHVMTHEIHHRGQVVAMLRLLGHEPPYTDLI